MDLAEIMPLWITTPNRVYGDHPLDRLHELSMGKGRKYHPVRRRNYLIKSSNYPTRASFGKHLFRLAFLQPSRSKAGIYATPDGKSILLSNGMVARMFRVLPNLSTLDIFNRMTGESMLRAVSSEGSLTMTGNVGNLAGWPASPSADTSKWNGSTR